MNKKQEEYIIYWLGKALALYNPRNSDLIMSKVKEEFDSLADDK